MKVSEKSLELNVGAEVLWRLRNDWGLSKAYLRGLTQAEERSEGVDFYAQLDPGTRIFAFQFKAPKGKTERFPYRFTIVRYQHDALFSLASGNPKSVYYVFPFFVTPQKLQSRVPTLLSDTWLLDVSGISTSSAFGTHATKTVSCQPGMASINPKFELTLLAQPDGPRVQRGVSLDRFIEWYKEFRLDDLKQDSVRRRRNPWLARGLRVMIVPPS